MYRHIANMRCVMLTNKSVAKSKSGGKTTSKTASGKTSSPYPGPDAKVGNTNKAASPPALYTTRELRLRSERSMLSVLLAHSDPTSDMEVVKLVHNRLPLSVVDRLIAEGVTKQEIGLVAPARTLAHRRANAERLTIEESDRAVRLARVVAQTESVFGNKNKAMAWLRQPMKRFEGNTPIEMLASDVGSRLVEEALIQIDEGFFA
jgi:putative toxin-antitoxin system antitoxin component (TIGR02293 family)